MGEIYHLFGHKDLIGQAPASRGARTDELAKHGAVTSYSEFISRKSKRTATPILSLAVFEGLIQERPAPVPDNIFLPFSRRLLRSDDTGIVDAIKSHYSSVRLFPTVTDEVYAIGRVSTPDYVRQLNNSYRALFQRARIADIMELFIEPDESSAFIGSLEETVHLSKAIDDLNIDGREGTRGSFLLAPRDVSPQEKVLREYLDDLDRSFGEGDRPLLPRRDGWIRKKVRPSVVMMERLEATVRVWKGFFPYSASVEILEKEFGPV